MTYSHRNTVGFVSDISPKGSVQEKRTSSLDLLYAFLMGCAIGGIVACILLVTTYLINTYVLKGGPNV